MRYWWDYERLVVGVARRSPVSNGFQLGSAGEASFYLALDQEGAAGIEKSPGVRYVLSDPSLLLTKLPAQHSRFGKLQPMATILNANFDRYPLLSYREAAGDLEPMLGFTPAPYSSQAARLQMFSTGVQVEFPSTVVEWADDELAGE